MPQVLVGLFGWRVSCLHFWFGLDCKLNTIIFGNCVQKVTGTCTWCLVITHIPTVNGHGLTKARKHIIIGLMLEEKTTQGSLQPGIKPKASGLSCNWAMPSTATRFFSSFVGDRQPYMYTCTMYMYMYVCMHAPKLVLNNIISHTCTCMSVGNLGTPKYSSISYIQIFSVRDSYICACDELSSLCLLYVFFHLSW